MMSPLKITLTVVAVACVLAATLGISAQDLFLKNEIGDTGHVSQVQDPVALSAEFKVKTGEQAGVLNVTAKIDPHWHIFSMTKTKGPMPSKISVDESDDFKVVGKFQPDRKPKLKKEEGFTEPCQEFEGTVTWSAPIELAAGVDANDVVMEMVFNGQTCESKPNGSCRPLTINVAGKFAGFDDNLVVGTQTAMAPVVIEDFQPKGMHSKLKARLVRAEGTDKPIKPGDKVKLEITATPHDGGWHIYSYSLEKTQYMSTIVGFTETNGWPVTGPSVSEKPDEGVAFDKPAFYHHHAVTWTFDIAIPETAENNKSYPFNGAVGFQSCTDDGCDPPAGATFEASIPIGTAAIVPVKWENSSYLKAKKATKAQPLNDSGEIPDVPIKNAPEPEKPGKGTQDKGTQLDNSTPHAEQAHLSVVEDSPAVIAEMAKLYNPNDKVKYLISTEMDANPVGSGGTSSAGQTTFWTALFGAFIGGMLLNLMPCVFPVLGLKVMGFVSQAGNEPAKIRKHGLAFAFGLIVSMWILAGIILTIKLSLGQDINWGAQMGNPYFVCGIIVLLFLLGLNMAGVFEIGTSLTSVGGKAQQKKGYVGSFLSGVLTTLVATPCSGPFLGAAMSYTLAQPAYIAMFLFTIFALGIAAPYVMLSFFPSLINRLPKPGPWMETFKITMAFALFATVAFFMQAFGGQTGVAGLSWLAMALVVIGLAAFFYGNWSESHVKPFKRWTFGHVMPALIAAAGIWMCYDAANQTAPATASHNIGGLAWQTWNPGKIEHSLAQKKKIIWVDYTADW